MTRGPRRSRRRTRARNLGLALTEPDQHGRTPMLFATTEHHEVLPRPAGDCCRVNSERRLSLGGTVMVLHRHEPHCPIWRPSGRSR